MTNLRKVDSADHPLQSIFGVSCLRNQIHPKNKLVKIYTEESQTIKTKICFIMASMLKCKVNRQSQTFNHQKKPAVNHYKLSSLLPKSRKKITMMLHCHLVIKDIPTSAVYLVLQKGM